MKPAKPFASYQPERPTNEKGTAMPKVKFTLDPKKPPKTPKADLARFDAIRDEEIDYSDLPELDADFWANAEIRKSAKKPVVTMRMDEKTLAYFKGSDPKGYTGRMAAVLKAYVQAHRPEQILAR